MIYDFIWWRDQNWSDISESDNKYRASSCGLGKGKTVDKAVINNGFSEQRH
jgi:hypothetical protein